MKNDIKRIIRECTECQKNKGIAIKPSLKEMDVTKDTFEKIAIDFIEPFKVTTHNNKFVITIQD